MNNNDYRREEFEKRRNYKEAISMCEGYDCPIFMNCLLEIKKLKQANEILKENAENNDKVVDKVNWENMLLKNENKHLQDNWNKLKKYINEANEDLYWTNNYDDILYVMQKLEGSDSNEI